MKDVSIFFLLGVLAVLIFGNSAESAQTRQAERTLDAYAPFEELLQVTPSDATTYDPPLRGCLVESIGGGTDLVITTTKGASVTITVAAAQLVPAMITKVGASTTATVICGR